MIVVEAMGLVRQGFSLESEKEFRQKYSSMSSELLNKSYQIHAHNRVVVRISRNGL